MEPPLLLSLLTRCATLQMALGVLRHPLVMCTTLLVVMACRRALRACVTRQLWILAPSAPKALLGLHSGARAAVVASIALCSGLVLLLGQPLSVGGSGLLPGACSAASSQDRTQQRQWWANWPPWSALLLSRRSGTAGAAASSLAAAPQGVGIYPAHAPSLASLARSSLAACAALWPHPILVGLSRGLGLGLGRVRVALT